MGPQICLSSGLFLALTSLIISGWGQLNGRCASRAVGDNDRQLKRVGHLQSTSAVGHLYNTRDIEPAQNGERFVRQAEASPVREAMGIQKSDTQQDQICP